jgi:hypothetical protein
MAPPTSISIGSRRRIAELEQIEPVWRELDVHASNSICCSFPIARDQVRDVSDRRAVLPVPFRVASTTCRRVHCAALPVPVRARLQPQEAVAAANYCISASRSAGRLRCGRWGHNRRQQRPRSWAPVSFVPRRVRRSGEVQVQAFSSISRETCVPVGVHSIEVVIRHHWGRCPLQADRA